MSGTHTHLPKLEDLKDHLEKLGPDAFHKHYKCYDFLTGDNDAMEFLEEEIKKYEIHKTRTSIHQPRQENL